MTTDRDLSKLLADWQDRQDEGEGIVAADLCPGSPELAAALDQKIHFLQRMDRMLQKVQGPEPAAAEAVTQQQPAEEKPAIPGYDILEELGRGGMGIVYRAWHRGLNRTVALKMALPELVDLGRFRGEAEAAARLEHPHIVRIYDFGEHEGLPYFSMECVEGGTLAGRVFGQPLPVAEAVAMMETLARAVQYAHDRQVIHRDLKPSNVLLARDGTPKITDFGLAKCLDRDRNLTESGAILGTLGYMAPEQAEGKTRAVGPAADLFALGVIFYEMLTGQAPFKADTWRETLERLRSKDPEPMSRWRSEIPSTVEAMCRKCLEKEPVRRYPNALALAEDLQRFQAGKTVPVIEKERVLPARESRLSKVVAALVLVGVAGALAYLASRESSSTAHRATKPVVSAAVAQPPTLAVRLWRTDRYVDLIDRVPLHEADEVQIQVEVPRGLGATLFLLGSAGRLQRLAEITPDRPARLLRFPEQAKHSIPVVGPAGTEVLLVCGRPSGPVQLEEVQVLLTGTQPWPALPGQAVLRLERNCVTVLQSGRDFGAPRDRPDPEGDVLRRLEELRLCLREHFELVEGLAFAHQ